MTFQYLSEKQVRIIVAINGKRSIKEIADETGIDHLYTIKILSGFQKDGYIDKVVGEDARMRIIVLTVTGKELQSRYKKVFG